MRCPVCGTSNSGNICVCPKCGFNQLRSEFINQEEYELWLKEIVYPYKDDYKANYKYPKIDSDTQKQLLQKIAKTLLPREESIIKMRFGLEGDPMSALDISKVYDVCVNRIYQIEAKFVRKFFKYNNTDTNNQ